MKIIHTLISISVLKILEYYLKTCRIKIKEISYYLCFRKNLEYHLKLIVINNKILDIIKHFYALQYPDVLQKSIFFGKTVISRF